MDGRDDLTLMAGDDAAAMAAAADYDAAWPDRLGLAAGRSVELAGLQPGDHVLDVACGTGGAALLAAACVGTGGSVVGVDLSPDMLDRAWQKARSAGVDNARFETADMTHLSYPDGSFDAVTCILGLFFAEDMAAQVAELWRLVRPGGRLVIATMGQDLFAPMTEVLVREARAEVPDVWVDFAPRRVSEPAILAQLMLDGGVPAATVTVEHNTIPIVTADDWWQIVMGTGLRRTVLSLGPAAAARVRERNLAWIREQQCRTLSLDFIYAVAKRP
jgi:SAM-dependent methyltransferase